MESTLATTGEIARDNAAGVDQSLKAFSEAYGNFINNTRKDLVAGIRTSSSERKALQEGFNATMKQLEEYCKHVRGNDIKTSANTIKNTAGNILWELSELRTGGKNPASGQVNANGGSLLSTIGVTVDSGLSTVLEGVTKLVHEVQAQMAAARDPSRKRKANDEQMFAEFERQRKALELQRQQEKKEKCYHPNMGQEMYLTQGEKAEFYKSLHLFQPQDFPMGNPPQMGSAASLPSAGPPPGMVPGIAPGMPAPVMPSPSIPASAPPSQPDIQLHTGSLTLADQHFVRYESMKLSIQSLDR